MSIIHKILAKNFRKPGPFIGRMVGKMMNKGNKRFYDDIFETISLEPGMRILEVGFGNGLFFKQYFSLCNDIEVCGVDISKTMIKQASKKNKKLITSGKLNLSFASIDDLPYDDDAFDLIVTTNTLYFWPDPEKALHEIRRVLKDTGEFVNYFSPEKTMKLIKITKYNFNHYTYEMYASLLKKSGFNTMNRKDLVQVYEPLGELISYGVYAGV